MLPSEVGSTGKGARWADWLRPLGLVLLGGALTLLAAGSLRQTETLRLKEHESMASDRVAQAFTQELTRTLEALRTAALMLEVHPALSQEQFNRYMQRLVQDQLSINVVEWQPLVAARDLAAFEAEARAAGLADFRVIEPDDSGKGWRPVAGRDPYVVVRYAWPEHYQTIGYDLSFSPLRMASKLRAAETGVPVASDPFDFMKQGQVRSGSTAIAISAAVFDDERRVRGYLAAVVDLPTLFSQASQQARDAQLDLVVYPGLQSEAQPIFRTQAFGAHQATERVLSVPIDLAGQRWRMELLPGPAFHNGLPSSLSRWTLAVGGLLTLLMAHAVALLQLGRRRTERAEQAATRANHSLRQQTERLLEAQRIAHLGAWQADLRTATISWSAEVAGMLGVSDEVPSPQPWAQQRVLGAHCWARFEQALRSLGRVGDVFEIELECQRVDGSPVWLLARGVAQAEEGASPTQVQGVAMDITARKQAELEISSLAFTDALTALPNRRLLIDRLAHALAFADRHQRWGALLFIDLDDFKQVNDAHGHPCGDLLLQQVARRLTTSVRQGDTVGRLGGDEFVVLLEDIGSQVDEAVAHAEVAARKLLEVLKSPHQLGVHLLSCTASIGVAVFGAERLPAQELLRRADVAMYRAKAAGRHTLCFYDPSMQAAIIARAERERDLREALSADGLRLHYQPQVDLEGRVIGVEALLRLQLPGRGLVAPQAFIALAEETGQIAALGDWVLRTAAAQLAAWAGRPERASLSMAVNVSPRQFRAAGFVPALEALLSAGQFAPQRLKLELTEGVLLDDLDDACAKMARIAALGVRFSLDDFGTGFSSLSYLRRLPLHQLKIDKRFVDDLTEQPDDTAIVEMVIALGERLGLEVIAEGVELPAQRALLQRLGCRRFQGYLFGRPMPVDALESLLDASASELLDSA